MSKMIKINAELRERLGKGASRAARRAKLVPAVIYGDSREPTSITIPLNEIVRLINRGGFLSQAYEITADKKKESVVVRDLQLHPVNDIPQHIDFFRLSKGATLVMNIPVHIVGEDESEGLKRGGVINMTRHDLELNVPADAIPEAIEISVASLDVGDGIHISGITLPEGCTPVISDRDFTICTIAAPSALKSADEEAEEEAAAEAAAAEGAEGAEGEDAAEGEGAAEE